jgi:hypothetical protein
MRLSNLDSEWPGNELPNAAFVTGRVDLGTVFHREFSSERKRSVRGEVNRSRDRRGPIYSSDTYGSNPMNRASKTARRTARWYLAQFPVRRRD